MESQRQNEGYTPYPKSILREYYKHHFPVEALWNWLHSENADEDLHREFTLILYPNIWLRFAFFESASDLAATLISKSPKRLDLGARYSLLEGDKTRTKAEQHELVFDIDINDYDDVRTCCQGAKLCPKCWKFMAIACTILDEALRSDFHFENILWTFSGRRGIHGWVCDAQARKLTWEERRTVAKVLQLISSDSRLSKKVHLSRGITPQVQRALSIIRPHFQEIIAEQQLLETPEGVQYFLGMLEPESLRLEVDMAFKSCGNSREKLAIFQNCVNRLKNKRECFLVEELMLQCCYPRLDLPVTIQMNHLLKSPFSVHPGTERISIPFEAQRVWEFTVSDVPDIRAIAGDGQNIENKREMVEMFRRARSFFEEFVEETRKKERRRQPESERAERGKLSRIRIKTPEQARPGLWVEMTSRKVGEGKTGGPEDSLWVSMISGKVGEAKTGGPEASKVEQMEISSSGESGSSAQGESPSRKVSRERVSLPECPRVSGVPGPSCEIVRGSRGSQKTPDVQSTAENRAIPSGDSSGGQNNTQCSKETNSADSEVLKIKVRTIAEAKALAKGKLPSGKSPEDTNIPCALEDPPVEVLTIASAFAQFKRLEKAIRRVSPRTPPDKVEDSTQKSTVNITSTEKLTKSRAFVKTLRNQKSSKWSGDKTTLEKFTPKGDTSGPLSPTAGSWRHVSRSRGNAEVSEVVDIADSSPESSPRKSREIEMILGGNLHKRKDWGFPETSEIIDLTESPAKSSIDRGLKRVKGEFQKKNNEFSS